MNGEQDDGRPEERAPGRRGSGPPGYERLTLIGRGGTASVYSATRIRDSAHVAIKAFDDPDGSALDRQLRAAQRLRGVDGIIEVLDETELPDGRRCLVFPFAEGSLADRIDRFGTTDPASVARLGASVARSLSAAHTAGVLHRDVKPSNILLDREEHPLLADFGAATTLEPATATDTMAVTIMYAAPELLESGTATERSDIYSLGLTLMALAIGRHPIGDEGDGGLGALVNRICTEGAPDPGRLGLPDGLAAVLRRATQLDPDDRYASGEELAAALDAVVVRPEVAPFDSATRPRGPTSRQRTVRLVSTAAAVAAVALVVGAAVWATADQDGSLDAAADTTAEPSTDADVEAAATPADLGEPVTAANGILGPLFAQDDFAYGGQLTEECADDDRRVALAIHADQDDRAAGVAEPWAAVGGETAGTFMAYLPCESGGRNIRYVLRAPGRWFTVVAQFPQDQYDRMVEWMRENETSPAPDYTVDDPIRATLSDEQNYEGWAIIDRTE